MKTPLLVILLTVSSLALPAQTYSYIPFPDSGMGWAGYSSMNAMGHSWNTDWSWEMASDTMIRSQSYIKILDSADGYLGYIRKDTGKRVYFILATDTLMQEKLLYDFSLNTGDTLYSATDTAWVTLVDTPLYLGIPRRTLHVTYTEKNFGNYDYTDNWIEGIGSTVPISIFSYSIIDHFLPYSVVTCNIKINSTVVYTGCNTNGIRQTTSLLSVSCFPNPATSVLKVNLPDEEPYYMEVCNIMGQLQMAESYNAPNLQATISVATLASGIYFLRVTNLSGQANTIRFTKID